MSASLRLAPVPGAEVHLLDGAAPAGAEALLAQDERAHAARLRGAGQAQAYVCAHAALRRVLAERCGQAPHALRFARGPQGKPSLEGAPGMHFSLSYRPGCAAVAIASRRVGVDVERLDAAVDAAAIARRFFTAEEQDWLARSATASAFFELWTRKEALVKACGLGIDGMQRAGAHAATARLPDDAGRTRSFRILNLDPPPGFAVALAVEEPDTLP